MKEIIDLTYPIEEGMPRFGAPWHPEVHVEQMGHINSVGRETRKIIMGTHTGTHMDAPRHFIAGGGTIDHIGLEKLMGEVRIFDMTHIKPGQAVELKDLAPLDLGPRVIFMFGWGKYWKTAQFYKEWPYFNVQAAHFLLERGVFLIGLDTPSPDDPRTPLGSPQDSVVHKILLSKGVILVEYLANLDKIPALQGWTIIAAPLKIKDADGAPGRVFVYR